MNLNPQVRDYLAAELFRENRSLEGKQLSRAIAGIPLGGDKSTTPFWVARLRLIRDLLFVGKQSRRALEILDEVHKERFADALRKEYGIAFGLVSRELQSPKCFLSNDQIDALKHGFLEPFARGGKESISSSALTEFCNRLFVPTSNRAELEAYVCIQDQDIDTQPHTPKEKRVWEAFDEVQRADEHVRSIADVIARGYSRQSEGLIDGAPIDGAMFKKAATAVGSNFRTGSPEAETRTNLIRRLHAVDDAASLVTRHTYGILQESSPNRLDALRDDLRIAEDAYWRGTKPQFENNIYLKVNHLDVLADAKRRDSQGHSGGFRLDSGRGNVNAHGGSGDGEDSVAAGLVRWLVPVVVLMSLTSLGYGFETIVSTVIVSALFLALVNNLSHKRIAKRYIALSGFVVFFVLFCIDEIFWYWVQMGIPMLSICIMTVTSIIYLSAKGKEYKKGVINEENL